MQWPGFEKAHPWSLFYKNSNREEQFLEMNLKAPRCGRDLYRLQEPAIYREKPLIKIEKYKNLQELLPFVPPIHHSFYKNLAHDGLGGQTIHEEDEENDCERYDTDCKDQVH
jgi:hypothetical protein